MYGHEFRYPGQWLTAEKENVEYRVGKVPRMFAQDESSVVARSRPSSASGARSAPYVNIALVKPPIPRVKLGPLAPISLAPGFSRGHTAASSELSGRTARQSETAQGFSEAGTSYGIPVAPAWESQAEPNGPGSMSRRNASMDAGVFGKNSGDLAFSLTGAATGLPGPPVVMRCKKLAQSNESQRWCVDLAEAAIWHVTLR